MQNSFLYQLIWILFLLLESLFGNLDCTLWRFTEDLRSKEDTVLRDINESLGDSQWLHHLRVDAR
jgi:hypothetical protein